MNIIVKIMRRTFSAGVLRVGAMFIALLIPAALNAGDAAFDRAATKVGLLTNGQARPGSVVAFTAEEIDAWVRIRVPELYPGVTAPKVVLETGAATGSAVIDFAKVLEAHGKQLGAAGAMLAGGEHPVLAAVRIESNGGGYATATPTRVEISNVAMSGSLLDFMIKTFLIPLFPTAKVGQPFELGAGIDSLEVRPSGVLVRMKKR